MATSPKRPSKTKPAAAKKPSLRGKTTTAKSSKDIAGDAGETYVVFGTVTNADATPAAGVTVVAYDKEFSTEQVLGKAHTDAQGRYAIKYSLKALVQPNKRSADLVIKVFDRASTVLVVSPLHPNAPARTRIDLTLTIATAEPTEKEKGTGWISSERGNERCLTP